MKWSKKFINKKQLEKVNQKTSSNCEKYRSLASDGYSCLGYSANWTDDAEECKKCKRFVRYQEINQ